VPELPEIEILARHLGPQLLGQRIRSASVHRPGVARTESSAALSAKLAGARFVRVGRRGKYLLFDLHRSREEPFTCLGHLGMSGRMFLQPHTAPLPAHTALTLELGRMRFVYRDPRRFGRFTLDKSSLETLGPEPLSGAFGIEDFGRALECSARPIKLKLLDQRIVAGVGNIYANEALFRAGIAPFRQSRELTRLEVSRLHKELRRVLREAIQYGSALRLDFSGTHPGDRLFYFGQSAEACGDAGERFLVYDREGKPCVNCRRPIRRIVQSARSSFYCPDCQR
jgi:formamidopyrimidine-DNA glycosylase